MRDQFVPDLLEEGLDAVRLDGLERDPVDTRGPVVLLGQRVGFVEGLHLADVDVQAPETPGRFSLRLDVDSPPQVLQIDGRLYHLAPASRVVGEITNSRAPSLHGHYPASSLLRAHPPPSRLRPTSRVAGYTAYPAPPLSRRDEEGFSSCSACPCHRAVATTPPERVAASVRLRRSVLPSPSRLRARPPGLLTFGATCAFTLVTAR